MHVTFAGSPDRVEARLVPEAGYELDTFRVSGFPRRPSIELVRSLVLAGAAPHACRRILRERRPDVVLGGGGFVAGPMVFAASTLGIPAALTEADAHFGLANRLAAPFAKRIFLSYPIATRYRAKTRVVGRPVPARSLAVPQEEGRAIFELPRDGRVLGVFGALAGAKALNEFVADTWGADGPAILHVTGQRDFELVRRRARRDDYRVVAETERFGAAISACDLVLARSGSTVWEFAAAGKPAILVPYPFATGDHQALNAQHFVEAGGAIMVRELDLDDVPELVRSLLGDPARLERMSGAMLRAARPNAADEIADELVAMAADERPAPLVRRNRGRRALRVRPARARVGRGGRRLGPGRTPYLDALDGIPIEIAPEPVVPAGWEAVVSSAYPGVPGLRRKEFLRELVSARRSIVVSGTHGKGTTAAMIAFALRETGADPAWLIGAPVPQLGSNAGFGPGYLVVEADESDRTVFELPAEIAVITNLELDHHTEYASLAELESAFDEWLAGVPHVVRDAPPYQGPLGLAG